MKKIYSLLCALAIVFSAVAAPQYSTKRGIEKHGTKLTKKVSTFSKQADPKQTTPKASKAPKAAAGETINLNFSEAPYSAKYYASSQDWYIVAQNDDYVVTLDILSTNSEALPAGTYNATDFDLAYTEIYDLEVSGYDPVAKASAATATVVVTGDRTDITAVIIGTDGNTYNVTMFNAPVVLKDPVEVAITDVDEESSTSDYSYTLSNAAGDSVFYFDIYLESGASDVTLGKVYTLEDMDASYSWFKIGSSSAAYNTATFVKTVTDGKARIEATVSDNKGNQYHLLYQEKEIVPSGETVALAFTVPMEIPQYYTDGSWELMTESVTGDTIVAFVYNSEDATSPAGSFTEKDLQLNYCGIMFGDEIIEIATAEIAVTESAESINLAATVVGTDAVTYLITMFFNKPVATEQKTFTSSEIEVDDALASWFGVVFVTAVADNDTLELTLNAESVAALAGTYVAGTDFNGSFTYVSTGEEDEIYSGSLTIAISEEGLLSINGKVLTLGGIEYTISLTYQIEPATAENVAFAMKDMEFTLAENYWDIKGSDPTSGYFLEIRSKAAEIAGTYTEADLDDFYTYVGVGQSVYFDINKANITVTYADNIVAVKGNITFVEASSSDTIYAAIDIAGEYDGKEHLEYDAREDFIVDFPNPQVVLSYIASEGLIYVAANNEDMSTITLEFRVAKTATDLAAGTYSIDATGAEGTVSAGAGVQDGYIVGSFAGFRNANNQITTPLWWMVSGTVNVAENGIITVDAVNSYDKAIKCKLGKDNTAVDNINADAVAVKRIDNGQLIIRKNGTDYNVMGVVIR